LVFFLTSPRAGVFGWQRLGEAGGGGSAKYLSQFGFRGIGEFGRSARRVDDQSAAVVDERFHFGALGWVKDDLGGAGERRSYNPPGRRPRS